MGKNNLAGQNRRIKIFFHIIVPISFGALIYVLWRGIYIVDPAQKLFPLCDASYLPKWVKYNLSDGLWFYSFLSAVFIIWDENFSNNFIVWILLAIIVSIFGEISQAYKFIPGTFDWNDMLAYFIAATLWLLSFNNQLLSFKRTEQ